MDKMGKGNEKNNFRRLPCHHMYGWRLLTLGNVWMVAIDPWQLSGPGGAEWVRFASPPLAPTAPAPRSSLLSLHCNKSLFSVLAFRVFNGWGSGPKPLLPCGIVPSQLSPIGLQVGKHAARLTPICLPASLLDKGCACRSGVTSGRALAAAGPIRPCPPPVCLCRSDLGPKGLVGTGGHIELSGA